MFGSLGIPELVMIFIVALLLFGPRKLPEIGRTVGKALSEFRRASNDLKRTLEDEVAAEDLRAAHREIQQVVQDPYLPGPSPNQESEPARSAPTAEVPPVQDATPPAPEPEASSSARTVEPVEGSSAPTPDREPR